MSLLIEYKINRLLIKISKKKKRTPMGFEPTQKDSSDWQSRPLPTRPRCLIEITWVLKNYIANKTYAGSL